MTPEKLNELLESEETSLSEVADAFIDSIRWIDQFGPARKEPEIEITRAVLAALSMLMVPDSDDVSDGCASEREKLNQRLGKAGDAYQSKRRTKDKSRFIGNRHNRAPVEAPDTGHRSRHEKTRRASNVPQSLTL